ncbi:MAG: EAL domain-containing protein [Nitrosomonadales bacterium]|nr:EAL domain-containing protein [Nitrosomonadales bacterium]
MTLFRQLFIGVSLGFLLLLAGIELIYVNNARSYLQDQLTSHSQDAATSLSMAVASALADNDTVRAETIVNAVFDRGYYQSIRIVTLRGDTLISKNLPVAPPDLPIWFTSSVKLEVPVSESMISKGWRQLGRVVVSSHAQLAYLQLWNTTIEVTAWLSGVYVAFLLLLYMFLKSILRPLEEIEQVANAISERDFKTVKATPKTRELGTVVKAINALSGKIHSIIDTEISTANYFRVEAHTDDLTKLDNRRSFELQLQAILDNHTEVDSGVLYLIQIANFQEFNSAKGYQEGDELIKLAGSALAGTWGVHHFVRSRINGATFAIAAFNLTRDEASQIGTVVCEQLMHAIEARQYDMQVSFGCGGTFFKNDRVTLGSLMAEADMAMLQSISGGNNKPVVLDQPAQAADEGRGSFFWKQLIVNALNENRLALLAQPVIAFKDAARLQYEVVGRIVDQDGKLIPASQFIPMAVRHNLSAMLDMKLIEKIFSVMGEQGELAGHQVAINLSIRSVQDAPLMEWLNSALSKSPALSSRIIFEFSEFGIVQDMGSIGRFVENIRKCGANFAVEKFGLHHSAFEYLQTLRPAYIKLSPIFIVDLLQNRTNQFFISSVVKITNPLGIKIFAHSIENDAVLELLNKLGVDGYQGFATGAPARIA